MFAYCGNNPVLFVDSSGMRHEISAGAVGPFDPVDFAVRCADMDLGINDSNGEKTIDINIKTHIVLHNVDISERPHFYDLLYKKSVEVAKENHIPTDNLMNVFHITWEFELHIVAHANGIKNAGITNLNIEETLWSMLKRGMGW